MHEGWILHSLVQLTYFEPAAGLIPNGGTMDWGRIFRDANRSTERGKLCAAE